MKKLVAGNWKLYCDLKSFKIFEKGGMLSPESMDEIELLVAVPYIYLPLCAESVPSYVSICAQDMSVFETGSYTGEVSAEMLKEFKVGYVILGHSERYIHCGETFEKVHKKLKLAIKYKIRPIVCLGEPRELRTGDNGARKEYLKFIENQFLSCIQNVTKTEIDIAYEPTWAIGTSVTPTDTEIKEVADKIRYLMSVHNIHGRILYGGSVTAKNSKNLSKIEGLEGVLIGKNSLKEDYFRIAKIFVEAGREKTKK